jgi:hypothetical protein
MQMNNKKSCQEIQQLLVSNGIGHLAEAEKKYIAEHLNNCEECRNVEKLVLTFEKTGSVQPIHNPVASQKLRKTLIRRYRLLNQQSTPLSYKFRDVLGNLLNYRIPVYQVIGILIVVLVSYVFLIQKPLLQNNQTTSIASVQQDTLQYKALDIFVNLNYLEQMKSGRNSEEDSLLTRYIFKSL